MTTHEVHIPYLSEDEKLFLNTTASYSQARRLSNTIETVRPGMEDNNSSNHHRHSRRHQIVSVSSISNLWKRRGSSASSSTTSSAGSVESNHHYSGMSCSEEDQHQLHSPKARELESLIFDQPQRTVRLSLTPRCAV